MNKIIDYEYFMDEMAEWEIQLCVKNMHFASKNEWEQARMIMYSSLIPYFKKGQSKKPNELFPLSTDEDYQPDKPPTEQDIERLSEMANNFENYITEKQIKL